MSEVEREREPMGCDSGSSPGAKRSSRRSKDPDQDSSVDLALTFPCSGDD